MKRSTILLITLLVVVIVAPILYLSVVISKLPSIKDWMVETIETLDADKANLYEYKMAVTSSQPIPDAYIYVTTYKGKIDSLHSVNFVAPVEGVQAELQGDSIIINLDNVKDTLSGTLLLTLELPENNNLILNNQVASLDVRFMKSDIGAVNATSLGDILIEDSNLGAFMLAKNDEAHKTIDIQDSNIGAVRLNGNNDTLEVQDSNIGAMTISGVCQAINLKDNNFGVVSWNKECNDKAVIEDCVMTVKVKENVMDDADDDKNARVYMIDDNGEKVEVASGAIKIDGEDGEKVDITPTGVHVKSDDGERVDISPAGVYVDDEGTSVQVTPSGVVVKENGEEVISVGLNGVKIK